MFALIILYAYFVSFLDKPQEGTPCLSPRAIEQRDKWQIPTDELDYPVNPLYIDSLQHIGIHVYHTSRWFNGATCEMSVTQATMVAQWGFVKAVQITRDDSDPIYSPRKRAQWFNHQTTEQETEPLIEKWTDKQLELYNLKPLHEAGYEGQGILMTVCDGGFYKANTLPCFRQSELELGHYDWTDDADNFYGVTGTHGTECLSAISGIQNGYYGAATKAQYYLMRSEEAYTESPKEMDNLVAALEKADSLGVNVFSVSLGYAMFDNLTWTLNKYTALDGKSTRASQAATIAARKGMLVCVAAGNEGNSDWQTISAPGDADSILTVGAVDTEGIIGSFSSYGPSSDKRIKPEVCAVGVQATLITPDGFIVTGNGTSFATPLLAGLAASLWSALPDENAMQIRERIIRSADRYLQPDSLQYGYGIPDAWAAYSMELPESIETSTVQSQETEAKKIIRGNQIYIIRHGHIYNLAGQRVY